MFSRVRSYLNVLPSWHSCVDIEPGIKTCVVRVGSQGVSGFVATGLDVGSSHHMGIVSHSVQMKSCRVQSLKVRLILPLGWPDCWWPVYQSNLLCDLDL